MQTERYVVVQSALVIDEGAALYAKIFLYDCSLPQKIAALNWFLTCLVRWQVVFPEQRYRCVIGAKQNTQEKGTDIRICTSLPKFQFFRTEKWFLCAVLRHNCCQCQAQSCAALRNCIKMRNTHLTCREENCMIFYGESPVQLAWAFAHHQT